MDDVSSRATVKYTVYFSEPAGGTPATALGLTNPLAVVWEKVPYSFVVDWFIPISDYLSTLDATQGLVFMKGCKTTFVKGRSTRIEVGKEYESGGNHHSMVQHDVAHWERIRVTRESLGTFPSPVFPSFKSPLGVRHALNALALMAQKIR
jgi:hypothetical protein